MTTPERWARIRAGTEALLATPPDARAAFLLHAFGDDESLRAEVEAQAEACELAARSPDFLAQPATSFAAPMLADAAAGMAPDESSGLTTEESTEAALRAALAGHYDLERQLGRGGTATVYLARDHRHGRLVALKVLDPALGAAMSAERFLREIRVTAGLTHPHILPLHDSGSAGDLLYYVMPYIDGETLRERLAGGRQLPLDAARRLVREVASALAYAHRRGVVHRDIKPANILLEDGHAVVADFGIARAVRRAQEPQEAATPGSSTHHPDSDGTNTLTQAGVSPGTPAYMAPEQARGNADVDHRADIYALGVVAYEALAGVHPFSERAPQAMAAAHASEIPVSLFTHRPDVPPALAALVMQALEKDPAARPQSATDIVAMLDRAPSVAERLGTQKRHRIIRWNVTRITAVAIALIAAGGALAVRSWTGGRGSAAPGPATAVARNSTPTSGASVADAGQRGTSDPEAYELYLKGHYYWTQRGAANLTRSIAYFQQAIARDSLFARAHAGLAFAYSSLPVFPPDSADSTKLTSMSGDRAAELANASAERAARLDPTLADAQLALGIALDMRARFREALACYRTAVALDPSSVTAHHWLGMSLLNLGRTDEAIVELRHATELDPLAPVPAAAIGTALLFARRFTEAEAASRRALAHDSTVGFAIYTLGLAQAFGGQPDSAVRTLVRGARLAPDDAHIASALVFAYAAAGNWDDAARMRDHLHRRWGNRSGWADAAVADMVFGDKEPLMRVVMSTAGQRRFAQTGGIFGCNPLFDPLRTDVRFVAAMRDMGVAACPLGRRWPLPVHART
ncbi:MAG TPA: protein kinase [Gemmatimonadaceae bacterium]|nr:protein kinase [Gemmatimonadaceae bacterium]